MPPLKIATDKISKEQIAKIAKIAKTFIKKGQQVLVILAFFHSNVVSLLFVNLVSAAYD